MREITIMRPTTIKLFKFSELDQRIQREIGCRQMSVMEVMSVFPNPFGLPHCENLIEVAQEEICTTWALQSIISPYEYKLDADRFKVRFEVKLTDQDFISLIGEFCPKSIKNLATKLLSGFPRQFIHMMVDTSSIQVFAEYDEANSNRTKLKVVSIEQTTYRREEVIREFAIKINERYQDELNRLKKYVQNELLERVGHFCDVAGEVFFEDGTLYEEDKIA